MTAVLGGRVVARLMRRLERWRRRAREMRVKSCEVRRDEYPSNKRSLSCPFGVEVIFERTESVLSLR